MPTYQWNFFWNRIFFVAAACLWRYTVVDGTPCSFICILLSRIVSFYSILLSLIRMNFPSKFVSKVSSRYRTYGFNSCLIQFQLRVPKIGSHFFFLYSNKHIGLPFSLDPCFVSHFHKNTFIFFTLQLLQSENHCTISLYFSLDQM